MGYDIKTFADSAIDAAITITKKSVSLDSSQNFSLKDAISKAYSTNWSMANTFTVIFSFEDNPEIKGFLRTDFDESINLNIVSIQTPDFTNNVIESFVGNRWRIHNGRDELYKFSITFRDKDEMGLYRSFYHLYRDTREQYFDKCKFKISLYKDKDNGSNGKRLFMEFGDTIIDSISNLSFSNDTQNQIVEFTVNFKCIKPVVF